VFKLKRRGRNSAGDKIKKDTKDMKKGVIGIREEIHR
jgi:hypothetical protein